MAESSRRTDLPPARALALARDALAVHPAGLLTDFDGTLSPIVADPAAARLVDGAADALVRLADRLAVVAVVTGRAPLDVRAMTGVPALLVAGNHGTEWLDPGAASPRPSAEAALVRAAVAQALALVPPLDGVTVEDKGLSATVHYRSARDPSAAAEAVAAALADVRPGLEVRSGRMSFEIRPVGFGDKGSATRRIIEEHRLRGVVVMGDDLTDLDMFAAVSELRDAGRLRAAIIGVGGPDGEVPAAVLDAADAVVPDPADAARLLAALAGTGGV